MPLLFFLYKNYNFFSNIIFLLMPKKSGARVWTRDGIVRGWLWWCAGMIEGVFSLSDTSTTTKASSAAVPCCQRLSNPCVLDSEKNERSTMDGRCVLLARRWMENSQWERGEKNGEKLRRRKKSSMRGGVGLSVRASESSGTTMMMMERKEAKDEEAEKRANIILTYEKCFIQFFLFFFSGKIYLTNFFLRLNFFVGFMENFFFPLFFL